VGRAIDPTVVDELERLYGRSVQLTEHAAGEIQAALVAARREVAPEPVAEPPVSEPALGDLRTLANQAPVIQLVNVTLLEALTAGASDVHLESGAGGLRVRQRSDGVLRDVSVLPPQYQAGIVSRVKLLAGLDIAERRLPQDGRARVRLADREVDLRISTLPALHGESVVVRILDHAAGRRELAELGMPTDLQARFDRLVRRPNGLVLVTGPTGSGKTTTLYAALDRINAPGVKIVTVEDPVEYEIPGVTQIPVNRKAGLGFANVLRSILRHDPDVVMVGEMRDRETAELAIQAALTGHLVFSTLHTNDAPGGVTRLVDMGIEPFLVAAVVQGILAQRLVRMVCSACSERYAPSSTEMARAPGPLPGHDQYRRARGCAACFGSGYRGRTGVYELLVPTEDMRGEIVRQASLDRLRGVARDAGMASLGEAAWSLARSGITSVEEVLRLTSDDDVDGIRGR
jgi:type II secretory ATPase GspE/PulE/Tfp pilus assembly ATPase PilB-like protein